MRLHATAAVESHPLVLEDLPVPKPGPGELVVRVRVCGVCRTDLHVVEGDLEQAELPVVPGHMVVGEIAEVGPRDESGGARAEQSFDPALGARVGIAWLRGTCGECAFCRSGRENLCERARFTGYHVDGGYAEYAVVPTRWAYPIPADFRDEEAAPLLCAGIIGYRALRLSEVEPGGTLGLYGFGNSAHIVLQIARARGCRVHVFSHLERHRELARELGADAVAASEDAEPATLDGAILFAPVGELVPGALRALKRGGTLACAGIHMSPIPTIDYDRELFGERTLRSVTANTRQDGLELLDEAARAGVRPRTTIYPLERANEALCDLAAGRVRGAAVLTP